MGLWSSRYGTAGWWSVCEQHFAALHFQEVVSSQNYVAYTFSPISARDLPPPPASCVHVDFWLLFQYFLGRRVWSSLLQEFGEHYPLKWPLDSGFHHWEAFGVESCWSYLGKRCFLLYITFPTLANTKGEVVLTLTYTLWLKIWKFHSSFFFSPLSVFLT